MSQRDLFGADERPPPKRKARPSTEERVPIRLACNWKHDGVTHERGTTVPVPVDILARQPWLCEVGANVLDVMSGALKGIGVRDKTNLQRLDNHCRSEGRSQRWGVMDSMEAAGLSLDPKEARRLLVGTTSPSLAVAQRLETAAVQRTLLAIKEKDRGILRREA